MSDNFIGRCVLVFQKFLQTNDSRQYESEFTNDQSPKKKLWISYDDNEFLRKKRDSLQWDQSEESDGKWQKGGGFQFQ